MLWIFLALFIIGLGIFSLRLYLIDHDKRKLMYSLGLFFNSISFFILGFDYVIFSTNNIIFDTLFHWGATTYLILIFYMISEQLLNKKVKRSMFFNLFLLTSFLSLVLLSSTLITDELYVFSMSMGTLIVGILSVVLIFKEKNISSFLFLLSILSILIASTLIVVIDSNEIITNYFGIFTSFISYLFIALIFMVSPLEKKKQSGIGSYFTIEKKLEKTKKELSDTKETFHSLFNQLIDAVVIVNIKGTVLEASQKLFDDLRVTRNEVIGKNLITMPFFDRETKKKLIKNIMFRFAGKKIPPYEITVYAIDGSPVPYEIHAGKVKYKGKTADMAVFRDIRERKKVEKTLHETESRYQTIFEKTGTAIATFGDDSILLMVNNEFETLTGYQKDEVEQKMHWYDFITEEHRKKMLTYHKQRTMQQGNPPNEYDCSIIDKTGKIKQAHVNIGLLPKSSLRIVSLIDITTLKEMQHQLETINHNLEMTVNQRTEEIQKLLKQKDEFIHQLGHDLKNPLGPLVNIIPLLEKHETNPKYKEMLKVVQRNVQYMKNLVVKTIGLAQLNSPNTNFTLIDINLFNLIKELIGSNQYLFKEKEIDVVNNAPSSIVINADKLRIEELFINLLNNAVKYSHEEGSIFIDASVADDMVTVSIKDTGIGMTEVQIQQIFNEFYKADSSRHDFDSSGLGMSISKRIVEKHGGKIWVESDGLEKGSKIFFTLPLKKNLNESRSNEQDPLNHIRNKIDALIDNK
jgi:PAS domain S-box-containing protein